MPEHSLSSWQKKTLGDLAEYINGHAFKPEDWGTVGLPIIRIEQMNNSDVKYDYFNGFVASDYLIDNGDLLFSWSATLTTLIWNRGPAILNQHIFKVLPKEGTDTHFLHHLLQLILEDLAGHTHGSTMKHIKRTDLLPFRVIVPLHREQQRIAHILDTIDTQIQETEKLIAKLKLVKTGLLHDLLTCGIDEHGDVRDPVAHPEQFKDSELGRIPREWEVTTLGSMIERGNGIIQTGPFGSQLHSYEYVKEGIPVIMPQDIQDGYISESQIAYILLTKAQKLAKHRVEFNDIVFARRGDLSRCIAIKDKEIGWICGTGCLLIRPPEREIYGPWLANVYKHSYSQRQIYARAVGSTMVNLNTSLLSNLIVARPSYHEQIVIVTRSQAHDARIASEEAQLEKLRQVKRGLMHDLLTGRVRLTQAEQ